MRIFYIVILGLLLLKLYSSHSLSKARTKYNDVDQLVAYDYDRKRKHDLMAALVTELEDLSKSQSGWRGPTSNLLKELSDVNSKSTEDILKLINESELREIIELPKVTFQANRGLSQKHNTLNLLTHSLSEILVFMDSIGQYNNSYKNPFFLTEFKEMEDSMQIDFVYGLNGLVENMSLEYDDSINPIDSLPIHLGEIKGDVKLSIVDPVTGEKRWYKKEF